MKNNISIGEIVATDYRAASVFKEAGVDFCCGGKKSIDEICSEKGINADELREKLSELEAIPEMSSHNYIDWTPGFLCDYIVNTHHRYVNRSLPELVLYTKRIASVHSEKHPELTEVAELFSRINKELLQHLNNEEELLFPAIKRVLNGGTVSDRKFLTTEISRLSTEHEFAGAAMDKINVITENYKVPEDGCNTYNVTMRLLEQFEDDLHTHIHLENNILFPKAMGLIN